MAITLSPSVQVREFDLTTVVPAVAQTPGAIAGLFHWGPVGLRVLLDDESTLLQRFLGPSDYNGETWFTASNFLGYGGQLQVVRAGDVSGNTDTLQTVVAATGNSIYTGNTTLTADLIVGMVLLDSSNTTVIDPTANGKVTITSISNNAAFHLSHPADASATNVTMTFREDVLYTAIAQESADPTINWQDQTVVDPYHYTNLDGTFDISVQWVARYPGAAGNSLRVSSVDTAESYNSEITLAPNAQINALATSLTAVSGSNTIVVTITPADVIANATNVAAANTVAYDIYESVAVGDLIEVGNTALGLQYPKVLSIDVPVKTANVMTVTLHLDEKFNKVANVTSNTLVRFWEFFNLVHVAPGQSQFVTEQGNTAAIDEMHIVVVDDGGVFSGVPGTVLETYTGVSRASDAVLDGGVSNWFKTVVNRDSQYIWWANDRSSAPCTTAQLISSADSNAPYDVKLYGGSDGLDEAHVSLGTLVQAYDQYKSAEDVDIGLLMQGKARGISVSSNTNLGTYLINNIAEVRKDCVVFVSPDKGLVVNNKGFEVEDMVTARGAMPSSSYAVMDSGYKYQFDKYNDIFRWVPLNGDIAGLCARTDQTNDPWWSPAGYSRGNIKNVAKLAFNPVHQSDRDKLYVVGINSVLSTETLGTVLYGDKTMQGKPSAFDRINVRRLFITLEKAIATAAKFTLFEFNDAFTRSQFRAMVNPYLADVQSRRGIQSFIVVCDATNNTPQVIDTNQFKAAMYIKPARSINYIILDFIAVPTGVSFTEVIGKYGG